VRIGKYADIMHTMDMLRGYDDIMTLYIVTGIIKGKGYRCTISNPFSLRRADRMFQSISKEMKIAIPRYRWVEDLQIEKYKGCD